MTGLLGVEKSSGRRAEKTKRSKKSQALGMTKGTATLPCQIGCQIEITAGPSTALRSGRDDNFV